MLINIIRQLLSGRLYWLLLFLVGIVMESTALYFQYALDYGPCPLCIHVRIGVALLIVASALSLLIRNSLLWYVLHVVNILNFAWLSERAYLLLGTERGFVYLECGVDPGLPTWLALDQWMPLVFEVKESCGYTPKLWFGISMAEALMVFFPLMALVAVAALVANVINNRQQ